MALDSEFPEPSPANVKLYSETKELYEQALNYLITNEHDLVVEIFESLFNADLKLKEKISKALAPNSEDGIQNPEKLQNLVELQGFYSHFHLNLFNSITDRLVDLYKEAYSLLELDMNEGSRQSFIAQKTERLYEIQLIKLMAPLDTLQGSMYVSLKESYKIVQERRVKNLEEITKMVILREKELKDKIFEE